MATLKHNSTLTKDEMKKYGHTCKFKGQHRPNAEEIYKKVSAKNKGRKQSIEQKLKNSINKKGTIHMTNGIKNVMIKPELEEEYLKKGFYRGRTIKRKNKNN